MVATTNTTIAVTTSHARSASIPHDWARLDLRRFREAAPSAAFEIPSVSGGADPRPAAVRPEVWR